MQRLNNKNNTIFGFTSLNRVVSVAGAQIIRTPWTPSSLRGFLFPLFNQSLMPDYSKLQTSVIRIKQALCHNFLFIVSYVFKVKNLDKSISMSEMPWIGLALPFNLAGAFK